MRKTPEYEDLVKSYKVDIHVTLYAKISEVMNNPDFDNADKVGAISFYIDAYCDKDKYLIRSIRRKAVELWRWVGL